jgi:hypothetical protein
MDPRSGLDLSRPKNKAFKQLYGLDPLSGIISSFHLKQVSIYYLQVLRRFIGEAHPTTKSQIIYTESINPQHTLCR